VRMPGCFTQFLAGWHTVKQEVAKRTLAVPQGCCSPNGGRSAWQGNAGHEVYSSVKIQPSLNKEVREGMLAVPMG